MPFDYSNNPTTDDLTAADREAARKCLAAWGRKGGSMKSEKKAKSSAANGRKGGRPRKIKQESEA